MWHFHRQFAVSKPFPLGFFHWTPRHKYRNAFVPFKAEESNGQQTKPCGQRCVSYRWAMFTFRERDRFILTHELNYLIYETVSLPFTGQLQMLILAFH